MRRRRMSRKRTIGRGKGEKGRGERGGGGGRESQRISNQQESADEPGRLIIAQLHG